MRQFGYILSFVSGAVLCGALMWQQPNAADMQLPHLGAQRAASGAGLTDQLEDQVDDQLNDQPENQFSDRLGDSSRGDLSRWMDCDMAPELIEECLVVAREVDPGLADRLEALYQANPEMFETNLQQTGKRLLDMVVLKDRDPELYQQKLFEFQHDAHVGQIAQKLRSAMEQGDDEHASALEDELRQAVMTQLALRVKAKGDYLERLERRVDVLRREIDQMASSFKQAVDLRVEELKCGPGPLSPSWPRELPSQAAIEMPME